MMDDVIYRQDVLDALDITPLEVHDYELAVGVIKDIPSAQQWIPCSERLPDIHEEVLTCDSYVTQRVYTLTRISDDEVGWEDEFGYYHSLEDVEAWMPLPEPYKEEK